MSDIYPPLIAGLATVATAGIGAATTAWLQLRKERSARRSAEGELNLQTLALNFGTFVHDWATVLDEIDALMNETAIDRVLFLQAWNGTEAMRYTTAHFQRRAEGQVPRNYISVAIDQDYQNRLRDIQRAGYLLFDVHTIQECLIKGIYDAEGVTSSLWTHIKDVQVGDDGRAAMLYLSFATHEENGIDAHTVTRCRLATDRVRAQVEAFANEVDR